MGRNFNITKRLNAIAERLREILSRSTAAKRGPEGVWLNSADVRFLFRITARSLDHWKKEELLLPLRIGGRNYFSLAAVFELVRSHRYTEPHEGSASNEPQEHYLLQEKSEAPENRSEEQDLHLKDLVLLDPNDYCAYLKISPRTEFRHRKKGLLPHIKIRGRIYYSMADILDMLERNKQDFSVETKGETGLETAAAEGFPQMDADLSNSELRIQNSEFK